MNTPEQRKIYIRPVPASRPRVTKKRTYNEPRYSTYKTALTWMLKGERIKEQDYNSIEICFAFPYPKGTPKKKLIPGLIHRTTPDLDNLVKGFLDALEQSGTIKNDKQIASIKAFKVYDLDPTGYIEFEVK